MESMQTNCKQSSFRVLLIEPLHFQIPHGDIPMEIDTPDHPIQNSMHQLSKSTIEHNHTVATNPVTELPPRENGAEGEQLCTPSIRHRHWEAWSRLPEETR